MEWNNWIERQYSVPDAGSYTVVEWAEEFIRDGIIPEFKKRGYSLAKNQYHSTNTLLNFLYRFDKNQYGRHNTTYSGDYGRQMNYMMEDLIFYLDFKCGPWMWDKLKRDFQINHFADDSEFAERLWTELPTVLFYLIDIDASPITNDVYDRTSWLDSDEDDDIRRTIDPYLLEYGKDRHRPQSNDI